MKDLKCGLTECKYNNAYSCCARQIEVTGQADCKTFEKTDDKRKELFEAGEDFDKRNFSVDTQVSCKADCLFNKESICCASGITVLGDLQYDAVCATYMKA